MTILFSLYTSPINEVIQKEAVLYHLFADDITLFTGASCLSLTKIFECNTKLNLWFLNNHFMLDSNKSDVMFVGSPILLAKSNLPTKVAFDGNSFSLLFELKILNVTFDSSFNFTHLTQASSFHLHAIKQVPFNTAVTWTISLVLSRLDYCKSFLF